MDYKEFADQFKDEHKAIHLAENQKESAAYNAYRSAIHAAQNLRDKERAKYDEVYEASTEEHRKAYHAAQEEYKKESAAQRDELTAKLLGDAPTPSTRVVTWMISEGHWGTSYQWDYAESVLAFLDGGPKTLGELIQYGRKERGWCSEYTEWVVKVLDAGVDVVKSTEAEVTLLRMTLAIEQAGVRGTRLDRLKGGLRTLTKASGIDAEPFLDAMGE